MPHYALDARTITPHFPGIGRYVTNLARALVPLLDTNERLTVLHAPGYPPPLPQASGVLLQPVAAGPFALQQQWAVPRCLRQLKVDLYHSTYYLMPYHPGVPTVLTVYDLIPLLLPEASSRRAALLFRSTLTLALRAAQRVITLSDATRHTLTQTMAPVPPITTIPAAADPAFGPQTSTEVSAVRARYELPESFVLYVGSNKPHKNLRRLVEAFHSLTSESRKGVDRAVLVIAGAWDPRYPDARQVAAGHGLESEIRWLGPVPGGDLPALYAAATAFVFPSLYEGFGLPPLEAMASGTPVACSNAASLPEVVADAALIFDPTSVPAIAGTLAALLSDAALRAEMSARGLRQADRFSWGRAAAATLSLYRERVG